MDESVIKELIDALDRNTRAQHETKATLDQVVAQLKNAGGSGGFGLSGVSGGASLMPARCTSCGAALEVDPEQQAAVCPYCGQPYIVEQAINNVSVDFTGDMNIANANITVSGLDAQNLLMRAEQFAQELDWDRAIEYYEKVLDIDAEDEDALEGIERVKQSRHNYIFYSESDVNRGFMEYGKLQLKEGRLVYDPEKKSESAVAYNLSKVASAAGENGILYIHLASGNKVRFIVKSEAKWVELIYHAKEGVYPKPVRNR